jgi:tetratricopeptide (TPR) repeat protein
MAQNRWDQAAAVLSDGDHEERANVLNNLAVLATVRGEYETAFDLYQQVLSLDGHQSGSSQTVLTYHNMGMLQADQGNLEAALTQYDRGLELCRTTQTTIYEPLLLLNRSEALLGSGQSAAAAEGLEAARCGFRRLGDSLGEADALRLRGRMNREASDLEAARVALLRSVEINRAYGESVSLAEALYELGLVARDADSIDEARASLQEAEALFEKAAAAPDLSRVREALRSL